MDEGSIASRGDLDETRWQVRVDLAAAHRIAHSEDMDEGLLDSLTVRVPGHADRYYQTPFGMHWSEVNASCFIEVDYAGRRVAGTGEVNPAAAAIHGPIHRLLPRAESVMHAYMPWAATFTRVKGATLLPLGQTEVNIIPDLVHDEEFNGLPLAEREGERLAARIGGKHHMLLANQGALVIGNSVAAAYHRLDRLERSCRFQVQAMWAREPVHAVRPEIAASVHALHSSGKTSVTAGRSFPEWSFDALKRVLDLTDTSYRN